MKKIRLISLLPITPLHCKEALRKAQCVISRHSDCRPGNMQVLEAEEPEEPAIADTYKQWLNEMDRIDRFNVFLTQQPKRVRS